MMRILRFIQLMLILAVTLPALGDAALFEGLDQAPPPARALVEDAALWLNARVKGDADQPSPELLADRSPRVIWLSISDGQSSARIIVSRGEGLVAAVDAAIEQAQDTEKTWVRLDVLETIEPVPPNVRFTDHRRRGVVLGGRTALLPDELVLRRLVAREKLDAARARRYLAERDGLADAPNLTPTHQFTTISYVLDDEGPVEVVAGHREFPEAGDEQLDRSLALANEYLKRIVADDGQFLYLYDAADDEAVDEYNILRHGGTIWAMLDLYAHNRDERLLDRARRAIDWLVAQAQPVKDGEGLGIVEADEVKLGGNALAAIAIARYIELTGDRTHLPVLQRLCRWMVDGQATSGRFIVQKVQHSTGRRYTFESMYYPGQAILALCMLHKLDDDPAWLEAARRAADYLIHVQQAVQPETLEHDHWLMYGLAALWRLDRDDRYVAHAMLLARIIMKAQHTPASAPQPDWVGSWTNGRSTPAATRAEGLLALAEVLKEAGRAQEAEPLIAAAERAIRFQLTTQILPEQAMFLPDPQQALGGFREDLYDPFIRNDYVQHNVSSLLLLQRVRR